MFSHRSQNCIEVNLTSFASLPLFFLFFLRLYPIYPLHNSPLMPPRIRSLSFLFYFPLPRTLTVVFFSTHYLPKRVLPSLSMASCIDHKAHPFVGLDVPIVSGIYVPDLGYYCVSRKKYIFPCFSNTHLEVSARRVTRRSYELGFFPQDPLQLKDTALLASLFRYSQY